MDLHWGWEKNIRGDKGYSRRLLAHKKKKQNTTHMEKVRLGNALDAEVKSSAKSCVGSSER